ncbi:DUF881 domain-containing protein [Micromonosporaceae bacterium DT55]|uniref:DUF881 domain-containing protein n=1 Tax=Melissospora conviva TaxID=3388432 RepID=UPI003C223D35
MSQEPSDTGTGWPAGAAPGRPAGAAGEPDPRPDAPPADELSDISPAAARELGADGTPTGTGDAQQEVPASTALPGVPSAQPQPAARRAPERGAGADEPGPAALAEAPEHGAAVGEPEQDAGAETTGASAGGDGAAPRGGLKFWAPFSGGTPAGLVIVILLALLGFTVAVQFKSTATDGSLSTARQEDLVRILSDLQSQEERLNQEIRELEESQRQLRSGEEGRQAALEEAAKRADELGILAGTLKATGPGMEVTFAGRGTPISASVLLNAVQELRGAGAEAMQISGADRGMVRIVASTYFVDASPSAESGVIVDGRRLTGPYTITVIGDPATMRTALNIPGGVVSSVSKDGGTVTMEERRTVEVIAVRGSISLKHAQPVS